MSAISCRIASCGILLLGALTVGACNNDPGIESVGAGGKGVNAGGSAGSGAGTGGRGGAAGGGSAGTGAGGSAGRPPDFEAPAGAGGTTGTGGTAGTGPGMMDGNDKCTATGAMAKPVPVDIFILLDRSGSMNEYLDGSGGILPKLDPIGGLGMPSKWFAMKEALSKFVASPVSAGIAIGLGYFPAANESDRCQVGAYSTPAVPVEALPGVGMSIMTNIGTVTPAGNTPTLLALEGAYAYSRSREMMTGRRIAVALATDGQPMGCGSTLFSVTNAATAGANMGILTFVIGVGKNLQALNQVAVAGGTKMAHLVENATADELAAAFKTVQTQATKLACSFMIPPPPMGMSLDPKKVNVQFAGATPAATFDIGQVADAKACGPRGGWYFDDVNRPTTVNLCDASCQKVNGSGEGEIKLLFGCASVIIE